MSDPNEFTRAGPVKVIHRDGSTHYEPSYTPDQLETIVLIGQMRLNRQEGLEEYADDFPES